MSNGFNVLRMLLRGRLVSFLSSGERLLRRGEMFLMSDWVCLMKLFVKSLVLLVRRVLMFCRFLFVRSLRILLIMLVILIFLILLIKFLRFSFFIRLSSGLVWFRRFLIWLGIGGFRVVVR